ncbi:MAG: hypothetical protein ACLTDS_14590 [Bianqueaceae bacterium]
MCPPWGRARDEIFDLALTKGRLANKTLELLEQVGIRCEEMYTDTRKLVFTDEQMGVKFFGEGD